MVLVGWVESSEPTHLIKRWVPKTPPTLQKQIMATDQQFTELAELAGGFIHEIKNHISTLGLNLQLLAEDFAEPQSPRERRALERVQRLQHECERLVTVSNDFLRFARGEKPRLQPTRLDELVAEMVDFL